nr:AF4/FMR2 family member lilli-like isoform X2 [Peromyscus maniculatus bairdii]
MHKQSTEAELQKKSVKSQNNLENNKNTQLSDNIMDLQPRNIPHSSMGLSPRFIDLNSGEETDLQMKSEGNIDGNGSIQSSDSVKQLQPRRIRHLLMGLIPRPMNIIRRRGKASHKKYLPQKGSIAIKDSYANTKLQRKEIQTLKSVVLEDDHDMCDGSKNNQPLVAANRKKRASNEPEDATHSYGCAASSAAPGVSEASVVAAIVAAATPAAAAAAASAAVAAVTAAAAPAAAASATVNALAAVAPGAAPDSPAVPVAAAAAAALPAAAAAAAAAASATAIDAVAFVDAASRTTASASVAAVVASAVTAAAGSEVPTVASTAAVAAAAAAIGSAAAAAHTASVVTAIALCVPPPITASAAAPSSVAAAAAAAAAVATHAAASPAVATAAAAAAAAAAIAADAPPGTLAVAPAAIADAVPDPSDAPSAASAAAAVAKRRLILQGKYEEARKQQPHVEEAEEHDGSIIKEQVEKKRNIICAYETVEELRVKKEMIEIQGEHYQRQVTETQELKVCQKTRDAGVKQLHKEKEHAQKMEDHLQMLELENTSLLATVKKQKAEIEHLQRHLQDTQKDLAQSSSLAQTAVQENKKLCKKHTAIITEMENTIKRLWSEVSSVKTLSESSQRELGKYRRCYLEELRNKNFLLYELNRTNNSQDESHTELHMKFEQNISASNTLSTRLVHKCSCVEKTHQLGNEDGENLAAPSSTTGSSHACMAHYPWMSENDMRELSKGLGDLKPSVQLSLETQKKQNSCVEELAGIGKPFKIINHKCEIGECGSHRDFETCQFGRRTPVSTQQYSELTTNNISIDRY